MADLEKQHSRRTPNEKGGNPLEPVRTKSREWLPLDKRTPENKPDDVDPNIWMEESSVVGIKERKVCRLSLHLAPRVAFRNW